MNNNINPVFVVTGTPEKTYSSDLTPITKEYCAVINVSDTPCLSLELQNMVPSFWFPINETQRWGHAPFYGAYQVVDRFYQGRVPVLIHCHAGANRSPSIAFAVLIAKGFTEDEAEQMLQYPNLRYVFQRNININLIPADIIQFLKMIKGDPKLSVSNILSKMDVIYSDTKRRKMHQIKNHILPEDNTKKLIYESKIKKFIIKNENVL